MLVLTQVRAHEREMSKVSPTRRGWAYVNLLWRHVCVNEDFGGHGAHLFENAVPVRHLRHRRCCATAGADRIGATQNATEKRSTKRRKHARGTSAPFRASFDNPRRAISPLGIVQTARRTLTVRECRTDFGEAETPRPSLATA